MKGCLMASQEMNRSPTMSARDWAQLLLLGALWGGSFFFGRIAVAETGPLRLVLYRVAIAALVLNLWLLVRGTSIRAALPRALGFIGLAILNNIIPFSLIFFGQTRIGAGLAAILNATTPFWTVIAANALTSDEKFTANKVAGILLGIAGTAVMVGPNALSGFGAPAWAQLCVLGAALSYAFAAIFARRFRGTDSTLLATGQLTASTLVMAILVPLAGQPVVTAVSPGTWAAVAALGILSTAVAYILFFNLINSAGATNASLVTLVVPVGAILLGTIFLGERLDIQQISGMVLIGLGLATIDGRMLGPWRAGGAIRDRLK
jgi:drug/metabolite transporter (DMT)-like permease